jgi:AcrR family transcriptional regulator
MVIHPPAARRRASREQARERILDAALAAFAEQGYEGTSLARVAETVGLSQPGVLHHFPSKRALLLAVLERRDVADQATFALDDQVGLDALDRLTQLVAFNTTVPGIVQGFVALAGESVAEHHPGREFFTRRYERIRGDLARSLERGVAAGEVRADTDCARIATEVFALMDGLQIQWLHDPEAVDMATIFSDYVDRLKQDLTATPS